MWVCGEFHLCPTLFVCLVKHNNRIQEKGQIITVRREEIMRPCLNYIKCIDKNNTRCCLTVLMTSGND